MLAQQGRPVIIRRTGQADVQGQAILIPVSSQSRQGGRVDQPGLELLPWKVFFSHEVQGVREPGFVLHAPPTHGQPGIVLVPTAPTVDLADQGVALMVLCSPLVDRTRVEQLVFTLPGTGTVRDKNGNPAPAPGPKLPVPARLVASQDPRIRDMVGADTADVVLVGRWGTLEKPLLKPDGLKWGMTSPLVLDGQNGTLTLKIAYPDPDLAQEMQFGARFLAIWRANS